MSNNLSFNFKDMLDEMKTDNEGNSRKSYFFPQQAGTYVIRLLPPLQGEKLFYQKRRIHWLMGNSVTCINQGLVDKHGNLHGAVPCAACDLSRRLFKTSEEKSPERELAYEIRGQQRYMYRIVLRGEKENEALFFESGKTIYDLIYDTLTNPEWGNILHPLEGRDFRLVKTGSGVRSKYDKSGPSANITPIYQDKEAIKTLLLETAPGLKYSSAIEFLSPEEIQSVVKRHCSNDAPMEPEVRTASPTPLPQQTDDSFSDPSEVDDEDENEITRMLNDMAK